ncbi:MAG TPA: hypothetical protein VGE02_09450 [Gemmatimonadales bacterium]
MAFASGVAQGAGADRLGAQLAQLGRSPVVRLGAVAVAGVVAFKFFGRRSSRRRRF